MLVATLTFLRRARLVFLGSVSLGLLGACTDETIHATIDNGPSELDHPTAWFPLSDKARVGRNRAPEPDAVATDVSVVNDPTRGSVALFNPGWLSFAPPVHRDFTVVFWMNTTQEGPNQKGWVEGPRYIDADVPNLWLDFGVSLSLDKLVFGVGNPNDITLDQTQPQSVHAVVDGHWHHVAVTRDGTTGLRKIFIDGALDSQAPALPGELKLPMNILVGQRVPTVPASPPLHAELSDLRFYDRVVSGPSIAFLAMH